MGIQQEIVEEYKKLFEKRFSCRYTEWRDNAWVDSLARDSMLTEAGKIIQQRRRRQP